MATLETAAEELVKKLDALQREIDEAHARLEALGADVSSVGRQVDEGFASLAERVGSFLEKVQAEQGTLADETQETTDALSGLEGAIRGAQSETDAELADAKGEADALADHVRALDPRLESLVAEQAEAPAGSLAERAQAVASALEEALREARELLADEVVSELEQVRAEIERRTEQMRSTLAERVGPALQAAYDDWEAKLEEVVGLLEAQAYAAARESCGQVVDWATKECTTGHEQQLDGLAELAGAVVGTLEDLAGCLDRCRLQVEAEGREPLARSMGETSQVMAAAIDALDAVKRHLSSFSFVEG